MRVCNTLFFNVWHANCENVCFVKSSQISKKCDFRHFVKRSLFTKNHEKFDHLKIWLRHYDFFVISNVLTGAPKNAKICLYCIRHGKPLFLGSFLRFVTCVVNWCFYQKCQFLSLFKIGNFLKFDKPVIFIKMMKVGIP